MIFILLGVAIAFAGALWIHNSPYFVERRVAEWRRSFEKELARESTASLRDRILKSDYWDLTEQSPLRETDVVKEFFARFGAEQYDEILKDVGDGTFMYSVFHAAERSIGYQDRPMIMDYGDLFTSVLKELQRRKSSEA